MTVTSSGRRLRLITAISLGVNALLLLAAGAVVQRKGGVSFLRAKYYETFVQDPYDDPSRPFYESTAYRRETSIFDLVPIEPGKRLLTPEQQAARQRARARMERGIDMGGARFSRDELYER